MRKVPDTWWGAIVVGMLAGSGGGAAMAIFDGVGSPNSMSLRLAHDVPPYIGGVVALCLLKHAYNLRRDQ
jgi:hypothetical protein